MKRPDLSNEQYLMLEDGYRSWLTIHGYSAVSVYMMVNDIRHFLFYLEANTITCIEDLDTGTLKSYYSYVSEREKVGYIKDGKLSPEFIHKKLGIIRNFFVYLHHRGYEGLPGVNIRMPRFTRKKKDVYLTVEEINMLFEATAHDAISCEHAYYKRFNKAMQARDRAMLVICYSCGLRGTEAVNLQLSDINLDKGLIHVRLAKNAKERIVPFNQASASCLQTYISDFRPMLLPRDKRNNRLFLRIGGAALTRGTLLKRLRRLQRLTGNETLINKPVVLHTLRHSIATHLLNAGMEPERIARFLGHKNLNATQEYIHFDEQF